MIYKYLNFLFINIYLFNAYDVKIYTYNSELSIIDFYQYIKIINHLRCSNLFCIFVYDFKISHLFNIKLFSKQFT